jgi:hypothetical protein
MLAAAYLFKEFAFGSYFEEVSTISGLLTEP